MQQPAILETPFYIDSIVPTANPNGGADPWYRYVISQGAHTNNVITGIRPGSLSEATAQLNEMVERLNERCGKLAAKKK